MPASEGFVLPLLMCFWNFDRAVPIGCHWLTNHYIQNTQREIKWHWEFKTRQWVHFERNFEQHITCKLNLLYCKLPWLFFLIIMRHLVELSICYLLVILKWNKEQWLLVCDGLVAPEFTQGVRNRDMILWVFQQIRQFFTRRDKDSVWIQYFRTLGI